MISTVSAGPIGIAGAGRVAQALARLLHEAGQPVAAIASRTSERARAAAAFAGAGVHSTTYTELPCEASRLIIAVPDGAIEEVAGMLAKTARGGIALHTCGACGTEVLRALAGRGVACGTLHPLQTIADRTDGVAALRGVAFAISGHPAAMAWAEEIASVLGGQALHIDSSARPLYHAAAVMASNYVVGLMDAARQLMIGAGVEDDRALSVLAPLLRTTVQNIIAKGPERALTGPVERGDAVTVAAHLAALAGGPATIESLYRAAGLHVLDIAGRRGLPAERAQAVRKVLLAQ